MNETNTTKKADSASKSELSDLLCCPCCGVEIKTCPFCGKPGKIYGCNVVGCSDDVDCSGQIDFGHWCGEENGIPAVHWVIMAWNRRTA